MYPDTYGTEHEPSSCSTYTFTRFANLLCLNTAGNHLLEYIQSLKKQVTELQTANDRLGSRNTVLEEERNTLSQHGYVEAWTFPVHVCRANLLQDRSPDMQQKALQLKEELQRLKNEQTEMYKIQGQNAQRLVDMNDKLRAYEESEKQSKLKYAHGPADAPTAQRS